VRISFSLPTYHPAASNYINIRRFLMGVFTYVYYSSLIRQMHVTVGSVLQSIVSGLTVEEQLEVIADLRRYLEGQGIKVPC
jgi:phosphatidate cytidylyltransferase